LRPAGVGESVKKLQSFLKFLTPYAGEGKDQTDLSCENILFAISPFLGHIHLKGCIAWVGMRAAVGQRRGCRPEIRNVQIVSIRAPLAIGEVNLP
jgi:hypothetical protein